ncbi:BlaI/MecI/CopY family transcriptional regulator [Roseivirga pacifica]|uniref:BlaI/MecI/CopY family transcriptional regulator n=1 Tax=Roseivirga pacifica TaxID=1267423 RepID=UPI003BA96030
MKELTKAEERVMQILWKLEKAFTREVVNEFKKDPPSYTTVATVLTVLEQKGFVKQEMIGNAKRYAPAISKTAYSEFTMNNVLGKYFEGSLSRLVSFFTERKDLDIDELEEIIQIIENKKEEK